MLNCGPLLDFNICEFGHFCTLLLKHFDQWVLNKLCFHIIILAICVILSWLVVFLTSTCVQRLMHTASVESRVLSPCLSHRWATELALYWRQEVLSLDRVLWLNQGVDSRELGDMFVKWLGAHFLHLLIIFTNFDQVGVLRVLGNILWFALLIWLP